MTPADNDSNSNNGEILDVPLDLVPTHNPDSGQEMIASSDGQIAQFSNNNSNINVSNTNNNSSTAHSNNNRNYGNYNEEKLVPELRALSITDSSASMSEFMSLSVSETGGVSISGASDGTKNTRHSVSKRRSRCLVVGEQDKSVKVVEN
ncbi:unnamed protein product [Ambrosiozyma monospora]|uniref:Unnamed protein product n=1 Tax=Ambrosiozyma monospora TaxID=43982 RepID=A0ACB5SSJ1_AMBMO|nr:unnamed protein product [Ambrosiozyma monospora]